MGGGKVLVAGPKGEVRREEGQRQSHHLVLDPVLMVYQRLIIQPNMGQKRS